MSRRKQAKPRAFKRKFWEYFLKCSLLFLNLALHSKNKNVANWGQCGVILFALLPSSPTGFTCSFVRTGPHRGSSFLARIPFPIQSRTSTPHPCGTIFPLDVDVVGRSVWTDGLCCIHFYNNHFHTAGTKWEILWGPAIPARRSYYCNVNMKMNVLL